MWNEEREVIESQLSLNEQLLWFGRPKQGFFFRSTDFLAILFSLMFCFFAIYWEITIFRIDAPIFLKLLGIPFILFGLNILIGRFFTDVRKRKNTYYGVTNERVIIISGLFNPSIKSLRLSTLTDIKLEENSDGIGTIDFGEAISSPEWSKKSNSIFGQNRLIDIPMFDHIADARQVYEIIGLAQKRLSS